MNKSANLFGGDWTTEKLERVRKYLVAYATIMNKQRFRFAYIDAFAGTGYMTAKQEENSQELLLPELADQEAQRFADGSARIALQVQPRFTKYIFVEQSKTKYRKLQKLKEEFPLLAEDITIEKADANDYIKHLCERDWTGNRAVMFLDPFGMQVRWETLVAIAQTKAIDLWLLFPLGVAVNRMIKTNAEIPEQWRQKLDDLFGSADWFDAFYRKKVSKGLFDEEILFEKISDFDSIGQYFTNRLKSIFAGVAENPLPLFNSRNNPLYLLCFAAGNERGAKTAVKIANDVLKRKL
ncbi:MAG: three-Cys-motif partner protein TcmP [Pyrinomonadaceae bacterium]